LYFRKTLVAGQGKSAKIWKNREEGPEERPIKFLRLGEDFQFRGN